MLSDIEIAQRAKLRPIQEIAAKLALSDDDLELYGKYKAKVDTKVYDRLRDRPNGKLIYTTAITATPAGEGKTVTTIGLTQALGRLNKNVMACLREPSLGPTFGIKGGAAGGGYSQVVPMEDINLHFTGDIHAVTTAHNLLAALLDNHIAQGNALNIDPKRIVFRRVMDMNDRQLRNIVIGLGGLGDGYVREAGFDISVASEIMAILCLAEDLQDLKERVGKMLVAYTYDRKPVYAKDLKAQGAVAVIMKEAIKPNLVQTLENTPAFVHGGPFANIAHGCSSLIATEMGLKLGDYLVTEAGFGADLGAEKFINLKCRLLGRGPDAVVIVASIRALKLHGGAEKSHLTVPNEGAVSRGLANLQKHIENVRKFGLSPVVALNRFPTDSEEEIAVVQSFCREMGTRFAVTNVWEAGGEGGIDLARQVIEAAENPSEFNFLYELNRPLADKIETIAREIYGAGRVDYLGPALKSLQDLERLGFGDLPICMAKTQYSLTDDPTVLGRPEGFTVTVREVRISAGAQFVVPLMGSIVTMPGLSRSPAAHDIDIDDNGRITGLF